jgi:excisionase family DNA binding protein
VALRYCTAMHDTDAEGGTEFVRGPLVDLRTGDVLTEAISERISYKPVEVADLLGVSERYVWTLIETKELKAVRLAGRKMVLREDLEAFVEKLKAERDAAARGAA